jgi:hypothetical protein
MKSLGLHPHRRTVPLLTHAHSSQRTARAHAFGRRLYSVARRRYKRNFAEGLRFAGDLLEGDACVAPTPERPRNPQLCEAADHDVGAQLCCLGVPLASERGKRLSVARPVVQRFRIEVGAADDGFLATRSRRGYRATTSLQHLPVSTAVAAHEIAMDAILPFRVPCCLPGAPLVEPLDTQLFDTKPSASTQRCYSGKRLFFAPLQYPFARVVRGANVSRVQSRAHSGSLNCGARFCMFACTASS